MSFEFFIRDFPGKKIKWKKFLKGFLWKIGAGGKILKGFLFIFFYRAKFTISRGFVYGYPLGDLCTVIPPKAGDFSKSPRGDFRKRGISVNPIEGISEIPLEYY